MKIFTLSPSEFAFGFESCKKCYYDKIANNLKYSSFFPPVFAHLDIHHFSFRFTSWRNESC